MTYDKSKNFKRLINKKLSIVDYEKVNLASEIQNAKLETNMEGLLGTSKVQISQSGSVIKDIYDDYSFPLRGKYKFEKTGTSTIKISLNDVELGSYSYSGDTPIKQHGLNIVISDIAEIGDYEEFIINRGVVYRGGEITYDGTNLSVNPMMVNFGGVEGTSIVHNQTLSIAEDNEKLLVMLAEETILSYLSDSQTLGTYITGNPTPDPQSPNAKKLNYTFSIYNDFTGMPADTDTKTYIVVAILKRGIGSDYSVIDCIEKSGKLKGKKSIYATFTNLNIKRILSMVTDLTINMDDGNGERSILTEKEPSMPNIVSSINSTITPQSYAMSEDLFQNIQLRNAEVSNVSKYTTQIDLLGELRSLALVSTLKSEITSKVTECLNAGALTQSEANTINDAGTSLTDVVNLLGDSGTGIIGTKTSAKTTSQNNLNTYEKDIQSGTNQINPENINVTGKLKIDWSEPALVDSEDILSYKVKVFRMKKTFSESTSDLKTAGILTPKNLEDSSTRVPYIVQSEAMKKTDEKRKTVSSGSIVYVDDSNTNTYEILLTAQEKIVIFIACVTEFGIVGDWSDPFVIDVPNIIVDTETNKKFSEFTDERTALATIKREIESNAITSQVESKIQQLSSAISDSATVSELNEVKSSI